MGHCGSGCTRPLNFLFYPGGVRSLPESLDVNAYKPLGRRFSVRPMFRYGFWTFGPNKMGPVAWA